MNFRSFNDLSKCIIENLYKLPRDIDLVVGIPRSGLLAANIIALHLNVPLVDINGFLSENIFESSWTRRNIKQTNDFKSCRKILVVDDTIRTGKTIQLAKEMIESSGFQQQEVIYAAVYATTDSIGQVDIYFEVCPLPRLFEWNMMHRSSLSNTCVDIDGVLCVDPTTEENDDGLKYLHFLENTKPIFLPTFKIGYLVTCRLEKYRLQTRRWLENHGIQYTQLIMMNLPDKETRVKLGSHGKFKAEAYLATGASLFIESSLKQSIEIANRSRKPVVCIENRRLVMPEALIENYRLILPVTESYFQRVKSLVKRKAKTFLSRT